MNEQPDEIITSGSSDKSSGFWPGFLSWGAFIASVLGVYLAISSLGFILFFVPSESMQPGLQVGDRFVVSKWSYGWSRYSLPFGIGRVLPKTGGRVFLQYPKRGDVVVFANPKDGVVMVKRVIGLPGDTIETKAGRLYLNGEQVERTFLNLVRYRDRFGHIQNVQEYEERIGKQRKRAHRIYETSDTASFWNWSSDNSGPFIVRDDHIFVMGDNRDNSNDSRSPIGPGQVPVENLIGKAQMVLFTFASCQPEIGLQCPPSQLWKLM